VVLRVIPTHIYSIEELQLPKVLEKICQERRGLVLVTGTTGSGKSTTLAAIIDQINSNRTEHVITIEDPIEFLHRDKKAFVSQREVEVDTKNFGEALRSALRQDPDVILVGEMRDMETIHTALVAAETGHLVLSTLHTLDATETIHRIIAVFPPHQQKQIRLQLASVLKAIISMRLIRRADGLGRVPAVEVLVSTEFIRDCVVNQDKTRMIRDAIAAGTSQYGMQTFDQSIYTLYTQKLITYDEAMKQASNPHEFKLRLEGIRSTSDAAKEEMEKTVSQFERICRS
jgi:twitching motility protein PilT